MLNTVRLSTLMSVANDLLNDALRLDNELSALATTCSLRSVSKVQINGSTRISWRIVLFYQNTTIGKNSITDVSLLR